MKRVFLILIIVSITFGVETFFKDALYQEKHTELRPDSILNSHNKPLAGAASFYIFDSGDTASLVFQVFYRHDSTKVRKQTVIKYRTERTDSTLTFYPTCFGGNWHLPHRIVFLDPWHERKLLIKPVKPWQTENCIR